MIHLKYVTIIQKHPDDFQSAGIFCSFLKRNSYKGVCNLHQLSTPLMDFCNLVLVCNDIVPKSERTTRRGFLSTVGIFSLKI